MTARAMAIPLAVTLLLYLPACWGTGWVLDDRQLLERGLASFADAGALWAPPEDGRYMWRPLALTIQLVLGHAILHAPLLYRLLNVAAHLANVALVGAGARFAGGSWRAAALLATVWALHPASPDVVCWNADFFDVLATTGCLAMLAVALGASGRAAAIATGPLFFATLLAKETAAPMPAVIAAVLLARGERRAAAGSLVAGAIAGGAWWAWHDAITGTSSADAPLSGETLLAWLQSAPWLAFVPAQAGVTHLFDPGDVARNAGGALAIVGAGALAWWGGTWVRLATIAWALLLVPVAVGVPMIGIQPLRYAYLPAAVAIALLGGARVDARPRAALLAVTAWALLQAPRVWLRIGEWRDEPALWDGELALEPDNHVARLFVARFDWQAATDPAAKIDALRRWLAALDTTGVRPVQTFSPLAERLLFAQAAYASGQPRLALAEAETYLADAGADAPPRAWCLVAASHTALGEPVPAEAEAACVE